MEDFQFQSFKGYVGELNAIYRRTEQQSPQLNGSGSVYNFLKPYYDNILDDHEQMKVVYLSNNLQVLNVKDVSKGGLTGTLCDVRLVMREALLLPTTSIVVSHNHPSGTLKASHADKELTRKIKNAAAFFDINVLDHIILTRESYYSFADEGLL